MYQQSIFKCDQRDKHFSEFLSTRWQQKSTDIDMEQNYVTDTLYIHSFCHGYIVCILRNMPVKEFLKSAYICISHD